MHRYEEKLKGSVPWIKDYDEAVRERSHGALIKKAQQSRAIEYKRLKRSVGGDVVGNWV